MQMYENILTPQQNNFIEEFKKLDPNNENANPYQRDF